MNIFNFLKSFFNNKEESPKPIYPTYQTGVIPNDPDYRDIEVASVQKPLGGMLPSKKDIPLPLTFLEVLDQGNQGACVPHAIAQLLMFYIYRKFNKKVNLSPRFAYKLCKLLDGIPEKAGTYPRTGALVFVKFGCCTLEQLANDTYLTPDEYLAVTLLQSQYEDAKAHTLPGFATVPNNLQAIKDALIQNDVITGSTSVGNWYNLPVKPGNSWHYTLWCGYEDLPNGDTKIIFKNQWGKGWLNWIASWVWPGYGYFLWSEFQNNVNDIIAFVDIPKEYLNYVKRAPYKFTFRLYPGMQHNAVRELQKYLNSDATTLVALDGVGSPGKESDFYGPATRKAVIAWQVKHGIDPVGVFGPLSIAKANERIPKMTLEQALILQESGGDDMAIGDRNLTNKAYGCLQIRKPYMDDVNKKLGTNYRAEDCLGNRELSLKVFRTYMSIYEPNGTDEEKSRCHNAGPGWRRKRSSTDGYWASVKLKLNQ